MPVSGNQLQRPGQLSPVLFWAGVGLAPIAALVLLVGQGDGSLRVAVLLVMLAIVLIGLSVAVRQDPAAVRAELEETIFDETDQLRDQLRQDIGTAARATHRQFSEKLHALHESVESLRAQVGAGPYELADPQPAGVAPPPQFAPHPNPPAPTGHAGVAAVGPPHSGYVPGGHPQAGRAHVGAAGVPAGPPPVGPPVGGGVVRHTETVQVTTRHTYVDPHADAPGGRGKVYGGTTYGLVAEPGCGRSGGEWDEPAGESWTEQRLRERLGGARGMDPRAGDPHAGDPRAGDPRAGDPRAAEPRDGRRSRHFERDDDDPGSDERWSGMRAGDRWAAVRSDERGREVRMGERRAALHSDETGTELRIEDRWASVRREEPRRWGAEERWSEDRWGPEVEDTGRWGERQGQAALPAASAEPGWSQEWDDDRGYGSGGRAGRRRYRDEEDDGYGWQSEISEPQPVRVRPRRADHDALDDRWR